MIAYSIGSRLVVDRNEQYARSVCTLLRLAQSTTNRRWSGLFLLEELVISNYDADIRTCGNFNSEPESAAAFDEFFSLHSQGLFVLYSEVWGEYDQTSRNFDHGRCRIDRIAVPTKKAVESGWTSGPFGVEFKSSNCNINDLVLQCIDYRLAKFRLKNAGDPFAIQTIIMWPTLPMQYTVAGICAQWRLATCAPCAAWLTEPQFTAKIGGQTWLAMKEGTLLPKVEVTERMGFKRGSRK